jgi:hypothetical protein
MNTGGSIPGEKRPGREADHSTPSGAEVKNVWSYTCTPPYVFMVLCSFKHKDDFTFYFYLVFLHQMFDVVLVELFPTLTQSGQG